MAAKAAAANTEHPCVCCGPISPGDVISSIAPPGVEEVSLVTQVAPADSTETLVYTSTTRPFKRSWNQFMPGTNCLALFLIVMVVPAWSLWQLVIGPHLTARGRQEWSGASCLMPRTPC